MSDAPDDERDPLLARLRAARPAEVPADLERRLVEAAGAAPRPLAPWGALREHGDALLSYAVELAGGDPALGEEAVVQALHRTDRKVDPSLAVLLQAARHAATEALARAGTGGAGLSELEGAERALLMERALGLTLPELARGWLQTPARICERLEAAGSAWLAARERAEPARAPACAAGRGRLVRGLLDLLDEREAPAYARHLEECPACAGWSVTMEETMTPSSRAVSDPLALEEKVRAREEPIPGPTAAELGIRVAVSCCYCHDRLRRDEAAFCAACLAPHHPECFQEHGRCATPGCAGSEVVYPTASRSPGPDRSHGRRRGPGGLVALVVAGVAGLSAAAITVRARRDLAERARPEPAARVPWRAPELAPVARIEPGPRDERRPITLRKDPLTLAVKAGEQQVGQLLEAWAAQHGWALTLDPQLQMVRLNFGRDLELDRDQLRTFLDSADVVLAVGRDGAVQAIHRRNAAQRALRTWLVQGDEPVDPDAFVSRVVEVRHGGGESVFSALRGLMTRDPTRVGNILYSADSSSITIVDFAHRVREYEEMALRLDRAGELSRAHVELLQLPADAWEQVRTRSGPEQSALLRAQGTRLEAVDLVFNDMVQTRQILVRDLGSTLTAELKLDRSERQPALVLTVQGEGESPTNLRCPLPVSQSVQARLLPGGVVLVLLVEGQ